MNADKTDLDSLRRFICVGECFADLLVEDALVVELKCAECLTNEYMAQWWKRIVHGFAEPEPLANQ